MLTPEGKTKALLKKLFKAKGVWYFFPVQSGYGQATLDCFACWDGQMFGIETKKEGVREPTPRQRETMKQMRAAGAKTYLVTMENKKLVWIEVTQ